MVSKVKAKGNTKKTAAVKKGGAIGKPARPRSKVTAKYEQPGAPWWKRVPSPPRKAV